MINKIILYGILLSLLITNVCEAQSDTIQILHTEELSKNSDFYYKNKYQYLDLNLIDETKLLKFSIFPFMPAEIFNFNYFNTQIAYESKINTVFSFVRKLESDLIFEKEFAYSATNLGIEFRYYFLKKKNIERQISGNNLNGPYFSIDINKLAGLLTIREYDGEKVTSKHSTLSLVPSPAIAFGFQKKFNNLFYIDIAPYLMFHYEYFDEYKGLDFGMSILMGLSFNPKDS